MGFAKHRFFGDFGNGCLMIAGADGLLRWADTISALGIKERFNDTVF
jgi:hypothetical protein